MQEIVTVNTPESGVSARLVGGPADLPERSRSLPAGTASAESDKIKVAHQGGYEHFERGAEASGAGRESAAEVQFHWTMRTEAAE